jgi:hypothetical protein
MKKIIIIKKDQVDFDIKKIKDITRADITDDELKLEVEVD